MEMVETAAKVELAEQLSVEPVDKAETAEMAETV
jgi:hypothetical protein